MNQQLTDDLRNVDFTTLVSRFVTDQAPRVFAVVVEYGEQTDAEIIGWGMELPCGAYMVTTDGRNQYVLTEPEHALRYVHSRTNTTPHLVWATPNPDK
ncbi:hypothetical protein ALI144C_27220 [Actinosynnema sp. ALI-1.44]|nr:hypothetical protein ALI144C_27220 [Actinosynnema sp. ALI-1.44]